MRWRLYYPEGLWCWRGCGVSFLLWRSKSVSHSLWSIRRQPEFCKLHLKVILILSEAWILLLQDAPLSYFSKKMHRQPFNFKKDALSLFIYPSTHRQFFFSQKMHCHVSLSNTCTVIFFFQKYASSFLFFEKMYRHPIFSKRCTGNLSLHQICIVSPIFHNRCTVTFFFSEKMYSNFLFQNSCTVNLFCSKKMHLHFIFSKLMHRQPSKLMHHQLFFQKRCINFNLSIIFVSWESKTQSCSDSDSKQKQKQLWYK